MARIIIFSDLHANLPALEATLQDIQRWGYDEIIHLGDAIAIGPYPAECLERLQALPNAAFVMGNHDAWLAHYCVIESHKSEFSVERCAVTYGDTELFQTFEHRVVPERHFLYRTFFGGRFPAQ